MDASSIKGFSYVQQPVVYRLQITNDLSVVFGLIISKFIAKICDSADKLDAEQQPPHRKNPQQVNLRNNQITKQLLIPQVCLIGNLKSLPKKNQANQKSNYGIYDLQKSSASVI